MKVYVLETEEEPGKWLPHVNRISSSWAEAKADRRSFLLTYEYYAPKEVRMGTYDLVKRIAK